VISCIAGAGFLAREFGSWHQRHNNIVGGQPEEPAAPLTGARQRSMICSSLLHAHINNLRRVLRENKSREKHHEFSIQISDDAGRCSH
jgi:hypothetical protein